MSDDVIRATLGITDGEDLLDIEGDIKIVFDVTLEEVTSPLETVGDVFDYIEARLLNAPRGHACQTLMAFNRIRMALQQHAPRLAIRPSTPLSFQGWSANRYVRLIERDVKLEAPSTQVTAIGMLGFILLMGGFVWGAIATTTPVFDFVYGVGVLGLGVILAALDPGAWPQNCSTIGDLARATAARNITRLAADGGRLERDEIWRALLMIVEDRSLPGSGRIDRQTRFA